MSGLTQEQALAELGRQATCIGRLTTRYDTGGAAVKADAARELAEQFSAMASVYDRLPGAYRGHNSARWLAMMAFADAAELNRRRADQWTLQAHADQVKADAIERQALPGFAQDHGMGQFVQRTNDSVRAARLRALEGGRR